MTPAEAEFVDRIGLFFEVTGGSRTMGRVYGRADAGGFTKVLNLQLSRMGMGIEAADFCLSLLDDDRKEQCERLEDFRDFCHFAAEDYRDALMQRWIDYRESRRN